MQSFRRMMVKTQGECQATTMVGAEWRITYKLTGGGPLLWSYVLRTISVCSPLAEEASGLCALQARQGDSEAERIPAGAAQTEVGQTASVRVRVLHGEDYHIGALLDSEGKEKAIQVRSKNGIERREAAVCCSSNMQQAHKGVDLREQFTTHRFAGNHFNDERAECLR